MGKQEIKQAKTKQQQDQDFQEAMLELGPAKATDFWQSISSNGTESDRQYYHFQKGRDYAVTPDGQLVIPSHFGGRR